MPPAALISFSPLLAGDFLWTTSLALLSIVILRGAGIAWFPIIAAMLGPSANWNVLLGQTGILCGGLFVAGMQNMPQRPRRGGALLACLSIKPQFCLLLPVILLASGSRRAFRAALLAGAAIFAHSMGCFGWQSWRLFLGTARQSSAYLPNFPYMEAQIHGITLVWALRSFHAAPGIADGGQVIAAAAVFFAWRAWRMTNVDPAARIALSAWLLPLAAPYGYTDDLFGFSLAFLLLMRTDRILEALGCASLWLSPALMPLIYVTWHRQVAPLFLVAGAVMAWRRVQATPAGRRA